MRIARSPIAWTTTCRPRVSAPAVHASRSSAVLTSSPRSFGASVNGSRNAAVCEPSEPSTKPFSPPICSHSSPRPSPPTSSRRPRRAARPVGERHGSVDARLRARVRCARANVVEVAPTCPCGEPTSRPARPRTSSPPSSARSASLGRRRARPDRRGSCVVLEHAGRPPAASRTISPPSTSGASPRRRPRPSAPRVFASAMWPSSRLIHTGMIGRHGVDPVASAAARRPTACGPSRRR